MRYASWCASLLGLALFALVTAVPAHAQATRTWISGVGDDANPCSRTAPCKTFPGAISKTATGGEINCLDPGGFGAVTITKSISLVCDYTEGGVLIAGTNGIVINAPAGSIVTLKGLDIECLGTGLNGIDHIGAGITLHIHKVQIRNCRGSNGNGILVAPSSGSAKVFVADSYITDSGNAIGNAGLLIRPTAGASANVQVSNVRFEANTNGIFMDGSGGAGASKLSVDRSVLTASSSNGIAVASSGGAFVATVTNSVISLNAGVGAAAANAAATLRLGGSTIVGNVTGVSNSGGTLQSFKNNVIAANGTDGTPITAFPGPGGTALQ
jgi:hypothetical protein